MEITERITYKCCIKNCPSVQRKRRKENDQLTFHKFPQKRETIYQTWLRNCSNHLADSCKKSSRICSLHFTVKQYTSSLKTRLWPIGVPTIFPKISAEESLKVLNSLIKQLGDTRAALNQVINVEKVDFISHDHIKKEVDEATIKSFEDVSAEESVTNYESTCKKDINKPTIFTYEEITADDITDVDETFNHEHNEVLNNIFKENLGSLNADGDVKLEIINDEGNFKSIQEEIKKELEEEDIKLEIIDDNERYVKVQDEFIMWNGISARDDCYLNSILEIKEIKSEDVFVEVGIKNEIISDDEDINCTKLPGDSEDTCGELPVLAHQISKQNDLITSEIDYSGTFPLSGVRNENDLGKKICYQPSHHREISHPKNVCLSAQEAANVKTMKSFERTKYDGNHILSARNDKKDYIVSKFSKRNSDSSETYSDPTKNCLIIPVQNNVVCIKLKPFKRKMKC